MSTSIFIKIQDKYQFDMVKNPDNPIGGPFPRMPVNEIPAHPSFEIVLEYSVLPGADSWSIQATAFLPTDSGIWELIPKMDENSSHPQHGKYVSIKTSKKDGAKEFLILGQGTGIGTWPDYYIFFGIPFQKGDSGVGFYDKNKMPGGILNRRFSWECTRII